MPLHNSPENIVYLASAILKQVFNVSRISLRNYDQAIKDIKGLQKDLLL